MPAAIAQWGCTLNKLNQIKGKRVKAIVTSEIQGLIRIDEIVFDDGSAITIEAVDDFPYIDRVMIAPAVAPVPKSPVVDNQASWDKPMLVKAIEDLQAAFPKLRRRRAK